MKKQLNQPVVDLEPQTVKYWRKRFAEAYLRFKGPTELANVLGADEPFFAGVPGFRKLESVKRGKASLELTAKAVLLMDKLQPAPSDNRSLLKRQKINVD